MTDLLLVRGFFILLVAATAFVLTPFGLTPLPAAGAGALLGLAIVLGLAALLAGLTYIQFRNLRAAARA